jgi:hypothetical protein
MSIAIPQDKAWLKTLVLAGLCTIALPFILTPEILGSDLLAYSLAGIVMLGCIVPMVVLVRSGRMGPAEVAIFFLISYILHFGIGPLQAIANGSAFLGTFDKDVPVPFPFIEAQFLLIAGLVFFWMGYFSPYGYNISSRISPLPRTWNLKKIIPMAVVLIAIGYVCRAIRFIVIAGSIGAWLSGNKDELMVSTSGVSYLGALESSASVGILLLFVAARASKSRLMWTAFFVSLLIEIVARSIEGSRSSLAFLLLEIAMAAYLTTARTKADGRRFLSISGSIILIGAILFPILTSLRLGGLADPGKLFTDTPQFLTPRGMAYLLTQRFHGTESVALLIDKIPKHYDFDYGSHFGLVIVAIIPRALWPNKPTIDIGQWFRDELVPPGLFREGSSVAITWPGEFYMSFGIPGIIVGMFLIGVALRTLNTYLVAPKNNLSTVLVYSSIVSAILIGPEAELSLTLTFSAITFALAVVACLIIRDSDDPVPA